MMIKQSMYRQNITASRVGIKLNSWSGLSRKKQKDMEYKKSKYNIKVSVMGDYVFIFNCKSGNLVKFDSETFDRYKHDCLTDDELKKLYEKGFLVELDKDEYTELVSQLENRCQSDSPESITLVVAPTMNCNMRCVYCFESGLSDSIRSKMMSVNTADNIIKYVNYIVKNVRSLKFINITWFGGEPLLGYDMILYLSIKLKDLLQNSTVQLRTNMITNGALLDEEKLQKLKNFNLCKVQITLDGLCDTYCHKKQTYPQMFSMVLRNIATATKYVKVTVRLNADKSNFEELMQLAAKLRVLNVNNENLNIHFAQLRDYDTANNGVSFCYTDAEYRQARRDFYRNLLDMGYKINLHGNGTPRFSPKPFCGIFPKYNFAIDPDGNLYKCEHYLGDISKVVGDIDNVKFDTCQYSCLIKDERCRECDVFPVCNYSQCEAMHLLTGTAHCLKYEEVVETIVKDIKFVTKEID